MYSSEDEYEELDYRAENQYWLVDNKLKLADSPLQSQAHQSDAVEDFSHVSALAVKKLMRYFINDSK